MSAIDTPKKILTSQVCFLCKAKVSSEENIKVFGKSIFLKESIKPENFANFPVHILRHFLARVCESSTHDFCLLPHLSLKSFSWLEFADVFFRRRQATAGNTSAFGG